MSDQSQGDGWWLASDGKWYPPQPPTMPPPPSFPPTVHQPSISYAEAQAGSPAGTQKWWKRKAWKLPVWAWIAVAVLALGGLASATGSKESDGGSDTATSPSGPTITTTLGTATSDASTTVKAATSTTASTSTTTSTSTTSTTSTTTSAPPPAVVVYEGRGTTVLDVKIAKTQLILDATHSGRSNFIVKPIAPDGSTGSSIVNEIGIYGGRHLILDPTKVVALQISADGAWKFTFDGLNALRMATPAERYESSGDDVLLVSKLPSSGLIRATFTATTSNFIVRPFDRNGKGSSSLVNEIAPWSGTVVVKNDTTLLEVTAEGPWTMALTS